MKLIKGNKFIKWCDWDYFSGKYLIDLGIKILFEYLLNN